jgi:hypothetical protein
MSNVEEIRKHYTEDNVKALTFSLIDSIYDIMYNTGHCTGTNIDDLIHILNKFAKSNIYLDTTCVNSIYRQMRRDVDAIFPNFDGDTNGFVRNFIKTYFSICYRAVRSYVGKAKYEGNFYPDDIATNGCKASYLFVHVRHPKHKLNLASRYVMDMVTEDLFKTKYQGE